MFAANDPDPQSSRDDYLKALQRIEQDSGPFDFQLVEPLRALANLFSEEGEHDQALQLYTRLLHVNRINNGFYHESHLPIVENIMDELAAQSAWAGLDQSQEYRHWLSQRIHEEDPVRLAQSVGRLFDWKLRFIALAPGDDKSGILLELEELAEQRMDLLSQAQAGHAELVPALYHRALVHYLKAVAIDEYGATGRRLVEREAPATYRDETVFSTRAADRALTTNEVTWPLISTELSKGRSLLRTAIATAEGDGATETAAMARLHLADWELLMGRPGRARRSYEQTYRDLSALDIEQSVLDAFFSRPRVIPVAEFQDRVPRTPEPAVTDRPKGEDEKGEEDALRLEDYFAGPHRLAGLKLPGEDFFGDMDAGEAREHVDLVFTAELRGRRMRTRHPRSSLARVSRGRGGVADLHVPDSLDGARKRQVIDDLEALTFRPRLEGGRTVASARSRMRYFFAADSAR
ncbi:tetratricopeptide repeat protein [Gilvimarinus sp. F26214L]